jgi:hypothetical protein
MKFSNVFWRVVSWKYPNQNVTWSSHENNPIQIKCYMKFSNVFWPVLSWELPNKNITWNSPMSFDQWSHENNPIKMLHEILRCLWTNVLTRHDISDKGSKWENDSNQIGDVTHNFKGVQPKNILTPLVMISSFWEEEFIVIFLL